MAPNCILDRHNPISLTAGQREGDFVCLKGRVAVCGDCMAFVSGDEDSEYLNGHSLLHVILGGAVYQRTLAEVDRRQRIRLARESA